MSENIPPAPEHWSLATGRERVIASLIGRLVVFCCRHAIAVTLLACLLSGASVAYIAKTIRIDTNSSNLIPPDRPWRKAQKAFDAAFPSTDGLIVVVVEGQTAELAERGAARLASALENYPGLVKEVYRPDGGAFFARHGLLYRDVAEVREFLDQLIRAQPMLATLARDPTLRGVLDSLSLALEGLSRREAAVVDIAPVLSALSDTLQRVSEGESAFLSWSSLLSGNAPPASALNRLIMVRPVPDFTRLSPAAAASDLIRQSAGMLGLREDRGVTVRLTGAMALADEEFASLRENLHVVLPLMMGALILLLLMALRSWRVVLPILATLTVGLVSTAAVGLAVYGQLNLISVAFAVLFLGLGVDFSIQFAVRYRAARHDRKGLEAAFHSTGLGIGYAVLLAAICTSAGFFAFLPTDYRGAAELGLIAGVGMFVAVFCTFTVLPALIRLARPGGEPEPIGYAFLVPADSYLRRHGRGVLVIAAVIGVVGVALVPRLEFDFNPLHLKSAESESVSTLRDLNKNGILTLNTAEVLALSLSEARELAGRLEDRPEVKRAMTIDDFVPSEQDKKLTMMRDAAMLIGFGLSPFDKARAPDDSAIVSALADTADDIRRAVPGLAPPVAATARKLARLFDEFANADVATRTRLRHATEAGLKTMLAQTREMLKPGPVTIDGLPAALRERWLTADGRARIEVSPHGDSNDNATLARFVEAVRTVAPRATGMAVGLRESSKLIVGAFQEAGVWALLSITLLLALAFRRLRDVVLTVVPVGIAFILAMGTCVLIGLRINFANIIALPLGIGIGVAFNIYFVSAWRGGAQGGLLASSLGRAVLFSALTTAVSFGSLWASTHPGTASMGKLLIIALSWTLTTCFVLLPALLAVADRKTPRA